MPQEKYIVNAVAITSGGGAQKTLSLLEAISANAEYSSSTTLIVPESSELARYCNANQLVCRAIKRGYLQRFVFEMSAIAWMEENSVILNLGGLPMIGAIRGHVNVGECAFSNLFYPEISFWSYLRGASSLRAHFVDAVRKYLLTLLDFWVFETEAVRTRAIRLYNFPAERCYVVKPAPSPLVNPNRVKSKLASAYLADFAGRSAYLLLAGAHPNKRLHLLPNLAKSMIKSGFDNFCFVLTIDDRLSYSKSLLEQIDRWSLGRHFVNVGPINYEDVPSLIEAVDAVCLFSLLESFSNNLVEAWSMSKPLVVTDADWSRESAGIGALYVDPTDFDKTAAVLLELVTNQELRSTLVQSGRRILGEYNTPSSRAHAFYTILEGAHTAGPCPRDRKPSFI